MSDVVVDQAVGRLLHVPVLTADGERAAIDDDEVVAPSDRDTSCRHVQLGHPLTLPRSAKPCEVGTRSPFVDLWVQGLGSPQ